MNGDPQWEIGPTNAPALARRDQAADPEMGDWRGPPSDCQHHSYPWTAIQPCRPEGILGNGERRGRKLHE